ncbi:MAG: CopG family ribbon-helix-helix protein [Pseudomonadota bacterium]
MSTTMTIRLDESVKERLDKLARSSHRTKSFLAADAIEKYIELNEWQIQEIESAINEADSGDFATKEQVDNVFKKWI